VVRQTSKGNCPVPSIETYLINLDRSKDRFIGMDSQLKKLGLSYKRFPAIDASVRWDELAPAVDFVAFERNVGRSVMKGEIGCYHSHLAVWHKLSEGPSDYALVLEDDVVFHTNFIAALDYAATHQDKWDFLKLNKIRAKQPISQQVDGDWSINAYIGPATGFGAYLIKRSLAKRLAAQLLPILRPIDHEMDRIFVHDFRHFGLEPFPSHVEDQGQSTITGDQFSGVKKFVWYKRLPVYFGRWKNLFSKLIYFWKNGQLFKK
jgi:glycosyl transferase, family 25